MRAELLMRTEILDEVTCTICWNELNGIVLPADDPRWMGPLGQKAHRHCRFMLVPLFEGIDPVMDITPDDQVPEVIQHILELLPPEEAERRATQLRMLDGEELLRIRELTLEDLEGILDNQDLLAHIFQLLEG